MVAGASSGLGFAVARALAKEGVRVSISSRNASAVAAAGAAIERETGSPVLAMPVDVRSGEAIGQWFNATVERFGGVDLLYPNSGGPPAGPVLKFDDAAWQNAFELLLLSAIRMIRLAVPSMASRGGGAIVLPTSSAVKEPIANLSLSTVIRTSVAALSKALALELAPQNIRVNQLIPGRIHTDRVEEIDMRTANAPAYLRTTNASASGPPFPWGVTAIRTALPPRRCSCSPMRRPTSPARACK